MNFFRILKFDFLNILRTPMLVIINTIFPLILWWGFGIITHSRFGGGNISSYDYYGVTTMILGGILISMTVTNTFMEANVKRPNLRISYAPVSKTEIYLSKLLSTFIFAAISYSLLTLIESYVFHCNFGGNRILYILLLFNVLIFFGCSIGTMVCCFAKSEEKANAIMPMVSLVLILFSGIFIPLGHFGKVMEAVSNMSPVKWVTLCAFQIIYDNNFSLYVPVIASLLILSIVCISVCQIIFKPEDYL